MLERFSIKSANFDSTKKVFNVGCIHSGEYSCRERIFNIGDKKMAGEAKVKGKPPPPPFSIEMKEHRVSSLRVSRNFHNTPLFCIRYTVWERSWIEFLGIQREKLTFSDTPTVSRYGKQASSQRKSPIAGRGRKEIHSPWSVQPVSRTSFINFLV